MFRTLGADAGRTFLAVTLLDLIPISVPFAGRPFVCLLWDHLGGWSDQARRQFARTLIDKGCKYAVLGGPEADAWHDAFDLASLGLAQEGFRQDWPERFTVTSGQRGDSLQDVAFLFAAIARDTDEAPFSDYLLVQVGTGPESDPIEAAIREELHHPAA